MKKQVWRYYCDYCKKSGCSVSALKRHEAGCTNNPNRFCGMCHEAELVQKPISELIIALGKGDKEGLEKLRELTDGCPACMLSAIRQSKLQRSPEWNNNGECIDDGFSVDFDFRKEKENFWGRVNEQRNYFSY